jgi:hypothetical protein
MRHLGFVSFLLYSVLIVKSACSSSSSSSSSSSIAKGFKWSASVDRKTGLAQSQETTYPKRTSEGRYDSDQAKKIAQRFLDYPKWLCKGSVTLGLFKAVPSSAERSSSSCGWDVRLKGTGTSMLALGQPSKRGNVVQFPLQGGLLVAANNGCLRFAVTDHGVIETNIVNYRPSICGKSPPITAFRAAVYGRTQTLVHAFVMWRFHRYCQSAATTAAATTPKL